ncbi:MAG: Gamma-glutamyltranspeptidase @ Glutathione hydrolase [uncultured Friedmanniella sp.]|uniref:Gamma-glutamyltranspeptidase @ Glutathione hydrolase n=1 Tax=uncultured Friedmanniella sp. TaxID=335381 RepID=A0A6J4KP29_9ACTN|nr:MAG: Gamma-glutamyltranspeptidase @ Glutathione hydrolase [uncultured Friedmanniella sp.]
MATLRAGGSAVDAAVAMMLVSCAAETIFTGLSGGGFATVVDAASGEVTCVDFFVAVPGLDGTSPGSGTAIEVTFVGQQIPYEIGPATVAVPGVPAGAHHLWRRWGRLPWDEVVAPGLQASYGTPLPRTHADLLPVIAPAMCVGDGLQVYCRPDGTLLRAGDRLQHRDHHHAYHLLAEDPDAFYRGAYAEALVAAVADGGAISADDLAAYRVRESEPRQVEFDHFRVHARGDDLDDLLGTLERVAHQVPGDPTTDPASALGLVDALRGLDRRAETTNVVAVDGDGNACALTTSLGLGSGVWVPGYGVHLNSMLGEGELIRNALDPGARMGSMMSPLVALDSDARPVAAAGAAGGSRIRPALLQVLVRMLRGAAPQDAIDAPRLNALPNLVRTEPGFSPEVLAALGRGSRVAVAAGRDPYFGGVSAISTRGGGADPRRDGSVALL